MMNTLLKYTSNIFFLEYLFNIIVNLRTAQINFFSEKTHVLANIFYYIFYYQGTTRTGEGAIYVMRFPKEPSVRVISVCRDRKLPRSYLIGKPSENFPKYLSDQ